MRYDRLVMDSAAAVVISFKLICTFFKGKNPDVDNYYVYSIPLSANSYPQTCFSYQSNTRSQV
jgi:hypothetical protein